MINLYLENSCFRRAIFAGLRYSGIQDDCSWIPTATTGKFADEVIKRYP